MLMIQIFKQIWSIWRVF